MKSGNKMRMDVSWVLDDDNFGSSSVELDSIAFENILHLTLYLFCFSLAFKASDWDFLSESVLEA